MEDILSVQHQLMDAMRQLITNFKKDGSERNTPSYIKRRLETLDQYWRDFQENHIKLCECENRDYTYFSEKHYEQASEFYTESRRIIQKYQVDQEPKGLLRPATPLGGMDWQQPERRQSPLTVVSTPTEQQQPSRSDNQSKLLSTSSTKVDRGNPSRLDEMYRKQKSNIKALERALNAIHLDSLTEKWEFDDALSTIQGRWNAMDTLHWEIDSELTTEDVHYENTYYSLEVRYNQIKKSINRKMWAISHQEQSTPKMEIPVFSGSYQQWTCFKDLFTESIHKSRTISDAQKMQYLKSKVRGEAERLIQHLPISSENYSTCWDILNHRYNNKRMIFSSHINVLLSLPAIHQQSAFALKKLHDTTKECLHAIRNLGVNISTWDPLIVHLLIQKVDSETHNDYFEYLGNPRELPTLSDFLTFLEMRFTALESSRRKQDTPKTNQQSQFYDSKKSNYNKSNRAISNKPFINHANAKTFQQQATTSRNKTPCLLCNEPHGIYHCKTFLEQSPETKRKTILKLSLCENCLYDHDGKECFSEKRCVHCKRNHNTLLHEAYLSSNRSSQQASNGKPNLQKHVSHVSQECVTEILLATAQIKVLAADGNLITMRALIDQGSQTSLITENAAQRLGLPRQRCKGVIFGIGTKENNCKGVINITATAINSDYTFSTDVIIMKNLINNLPNRTFSKPAWEHLESIQLADPEFNISRPVDILLGADIYSNIILSGIIRQDENQPIAQQSRLGWIICGNLKSSYQCNVVLHNLEDISRFWAIEDIADNSINMSSEDYYCLQQYETETKRLSDGRYVVRLPLKPEIEQNLGESRQKAVAQLYQLERKFEKNENIAELYKAFMKEYIDLNHMQQCTRNCNTTPSYYLPHHCVLRSDSTTTKLRVVFNASARTSTGYSLNDMMYSGPNLQIDIMTLIIKWRQYKIAFSADIEKFFRAILCNEKDQIYQKIMWRDNTNEPLREYQLTTVTYGTKAAPFLAMKTLKQLAHDEGHRFPEAAKILEQEIYMDDILSGAHSITSAMKIQQDLINLLKAGGFNLRKWNSNYKELIENVSSDSNNQNGYEFKQKELTKALGLHWSAENDFFSFNLKINTSSTKPATKRSLLSEISSIFDPLGWLCPITTKLKLLFQAVWRQELKWDDQLPQNIAQEWSTIKLDLEDINKIQVPRWLKNQGQDDIELHGFCDSSERAYACVIYCKVKSKEQEQSSSVVMVAAKSRLVPSSKCVSLPRLELCAALLLSSLMKTVLNSLSDQNIKIFGWSDSTAVLGWIQGDIQRWKPFVANRVQKIKDIIPASSWRHVKSADNPADCASRGITASNLLNHSLWWQGPTWLPTYKKDDTIVSYNTDQELRKTPQTNVTVRRHDYDVIDELISKHSCLTRVTRILTWVLRAVSRYKSKPKHLTAPEIRKATNIIIKYIQQKEYTKEILTIKQKGVVQHDSKLISLNPFLDEEDLLRVGGRIQHANIDENMKHPLILPHNGHFIDIIIDHTHKMTFHGGARVTLAKLRQRYWIIGGNRAVKKRIRECVICRKHNPAKQTQIMGDLPSARCNPTRPFHHTGVDYTGFIQVKSSKGRGVKTTKGYIAVFVCMVTKALHLELVSDLSSSTFLAAVRRLAARRGAPRHMYSDNGTNFVGASKLLKNEFGRLQSTLDSEFFSAIADLEIEWHFNAPSWPSAGGLWEAAVKSLKFHLRRVIGEQKLTYEELSTLLSQLEAVLNSRPLCALSEDINDINYLTPSQFLASGPTLTIVETERDERTRWQLVQKIFTDVWKRWKSEYLCQLSIRSKWQQKQENPQINDIIVINDANLPPGKWALGRIIDIHPGKDGFVRVVSIKTKNGLIKRPISKISTLVPSTRINQSSTSTDITDTADRIKTRKTRGKTACNFITLAITLLLTILSPAQCAYNILNLKSNQSIYLDKLSNMHLIRDQWKLIVYYDMEPYWQGMTLIDKYYKNLETICSSAAKQTKCEILLHQIRHEAAELEYYNNVLLGQQNTRAERKRRGLINGVGYIARSLFGILDEEFALKYEKDIDQIRENQKHLALLWKNQTSVVEAEYNLLKRVEDSMSKQQEVYIQHITELEKASNTLAKEVRDVEIITEFMLSTLITNSILTNLKNIQETLLDTISNIQYEKFNIHILTPDQLHQELNIISGQLAKQLSLPIDNIQTNLPSIYHLLKVKARMTNKYFIFEIQIPLVSRDSYEIYRLIAVPQQVKREMVSIKPTADHMAISILKDSYIPLSEVEVQRCTSFDSDTQLCPLQKPIFHMKSDDHLCIKNQNTHECEVDTQPCKNNWVELNKINTYLYFCCERCTIRIICEHQVTAKQLSKAGIITLGDGCTIKDENITILAHKQQMTNFKVKPELEEINIAPINDVINITIPLKIIEKTEETEHDRYQERLIHVGQEIDLMKTSDPTIGLSDSISHHDIHQYAVMYTILGAGILVAVLYAGRRLRRKCSARLPAAPLSERSLGLSAHFTNSEPRMELSRAYQLTQPQDLIHNKVVSATTASNPSARALDKATSPQTCKRFSECE